MYATSEWIYYFFSADTNCISNLISSSSPTIHLQLYALVIQIGIIHRRMYSETFRVMWKLNQYFEALLVLFIIIKKKKNRKVDR